MATQTIPGYSYGSPSLPPASVSVAELAKLRQATLLGDDDIAALREAKAILAPKVEELLDVWYGFVGGHDFLLASFVTPAGPDMDYLGRVRARFGQWVLDTLDANFDAGWLAYQAEIGRRHAGQAKNRTDSVDGAPEAVPHRYLVALIVPIVATVRPFLAAGARDADQLERMHQAWFKAVTLSVALWSEPYVREGWF